MPSRRRFCGSSEARRSGAPRAPGSRRRPGGFPFTKLPGSTTLNLELPFTRADLAIQRGEASKAIDLLRPAAAFDISEFSPVYIRGIAYLKAIKALSRRAFVSLTFDLRRPAMKMGCVTCGVKFQTALGPLNKFASCVRNLARAPACSRKAFQVQPIVFNGKTLLVASCTQEQGAPAFGVNATQFNRRSLIA
jgi:hypothetical protein